MVTARSVSSGFMPANGSSSSSILGSAAMAMRDAECPEIAVRQVARLLVHDVAEAEIGQDLGGALAEPALVGARGAGREIDAGDGGVQAQMVRHDDVLERGHLLEDGGLLEGPHHALAGDDVRAERR